MPTTYTTNTHLALQATGEDSGTWGQNLNADVFTVLDGVLGNVQTISLSSANVTLTTTQTQVAFIKLSGVLTANVTVFFPPIGRGFAIQNATTGPYTVTLAITGTPGATAVVPQNSGSIQNFILDNTNVYADFGGTPPGEIKMFAMGTTPYGYFVCDGSAVSRTTYAALFAAIGTTYGSGDGATTFNIPDARGYFPRAWDDGAGRDPGRAIGTTQASQNLAHVHGVNDPGHSHTYQSRATSTGGTLQGGGPYIPIETFATSVSVTGVSIQSAGGDESRPINMAFLFVIKW